MGLSDIVKSVAPSAFSAIGGITGSLSNMFANDANMAFSREQFEYQKELARNQLQWRVEDAKKAGLHPMAALGLQGTSFSPVSSNMQGSDYSWISELGQSAGYAAMKAKDKDAQAEAASLAVENSRLQNEGLYLDNEFRRFQLQQAVVGATSQALRSPGSASTSGLPSAKYAIPGQADSTLSSTKQGSDFELGSPFFPLVPSEKPGVYNFGVDSDSLDALGVFAPFALPFPSLKGEHARFFGLRPTVKDSYGKTITTIYSPSAGGFVDINSPAGRKALASEKRSKSFRKEQFDAARRFWKKPSWRDYFKSKSLF